jgi:putative NIF3 family GTP cyclohydrolase 1 type 2
MIVDKAMNAADIVEKIKTVLGTAWSPSSADEFQAGTPETKITGIAVAWTPTLEVLEKAVAEKKNLVLTKEGPFWEDSAPRPERKVSGASPTAVIEQTALYRYKRDYLEKNGLVVWRFSQGWNHPEKSFALHGLASSLGWEGYAQSAKNDSLRSMGAAAYTLPPGSLETLMETLKRKLDAPAARALGDPEAIIRNVVLQPGFLSKLDMMSVANNAKPDAVVCGEGCEWEAFEYAEDWITAGWGKAMVMTGLAVSADAGARHIAAWLQSLNLGVPVSFLATGSPFAAVVGDHA